MGGGNGRKETIFEGFRRRLQDNIKTELKEIGCDSFD